jgi:hypothetical protein
LFGWGGLVAMQIVCIIIGVILAMKKWLIKNEKIN